MPRLPPTRYAFQIGDEWFLSPYPPDAPNRDAKAFPSRRDLLRYCNPERRKDGTRYERFHVIWESYDAIGRLVLSTPVGLA